MDLYDADRTHDGVRMCVCGLRTHNTHLTGHVRSFSNYYSSRTLATLARDLSQKSDD